MLIYNVTINIENDVQAEWLAWMKATHVPEVMSTGMFTEHRICRLIGDEDTGGVTYAVQYGCKDMETYLRYLREFDLPMQAKLAEKYPEKYVLFTSLLKIVD